MQASLFGPQGIVQYADENDFVRAYITIGDGKPEQYLITGRTSGEQRFRFQYDVAIDGSEYFLSAGQGKGSFEFTILEGPFSCGADKKECFASKYSKMNEYKSRKISVVIPMGKLSFDKKSKSMTTSSSASFLGIISDATITQELERDGEYAIFTRIDAEGMWQ